MNTIRTLAAAGAVAAALVGGTLLVAANADDVTADPGVVGSLSATTAPSPDRVVVVTQPQSVTTDALDPTTVVPGVAESRDDDHDDDDDDRGDDQEDDDHDDGEHEEEDEFEGHDDDD